MNILVSACLIGINCKYDSKNNYNKSIAELSGNHIIIPICPEQLGGLTTPRIPAEICGGDGNSVLAGYAFVKNSIGADVSNQFIKGAKETLNIAKLCKAKIAILKAKSPSCGKGCIYDGTFTHSLRIGNGVTAQILIDHGIEVFSDNDNFYSYL